MKEEKEGGCDGLSVYSSVCELTISQLVRIQEIICKKKGVSPSSDFQSEFLPLNKHTWLETAVYY